MFHPLNSVQLDVIWLGLNQPTVTWPEHGCHEVSIKLQKKRKPTLTNKILGVKIIAWIQLFYIVLLGLPCGMKI